MKTKRIILGVFLLFFLQTWFFISPVRGQDLPIKNFTRQFSKKGNEKVTMDFDNVDIRLVIKFMSELIGKNFILDNRVKGKVTVISPKEIPVKDAYAIFESILEVNGYTTVTTNDIIKIIPDSHAASKNLETIHGDSPKLKENNDDTMVTQIISLEYAAADKVKAIIHPLISRESKILSYLPTNMLILTERISNINRLMGIIKEIDVKGEDSIITILSINHAQVEVLARQLQTLFAEKKSAKRSGKAKTAQGARLKILPDERTDTIIIMAGLEQIEEMKEVIKKLDIPTPKEKDNIQVYFLKNSKAEEMAKLLSQIMSKTLAKPKRDGKSSGPPPTVVADKATNSLIITADPDDFSVLERILKKLDIMRPQVLVEALIAEVSYEKSRELGVEWRAMRDLSDNGDIIPFAGTNFGDINGMTTSMLPPSGMFIGLTKGFIEVGGVSFPNLAALIAAYQQDSDVNILSTPHILTTDNEEAEIVVGEEIPLPTKDVINDISSYSTNYKNVGLTLRITPHISQDGYVKLEIYYEQKKITSYMETPSGTFPTAATRQVKTTIVLKDKQTAVLGGMIRDDKFESAQRVPCLGSLPLIGRIFQSSSNQGQKTNLQIFITPHIIENPEDIAVFTTNMKDKLEDDEKQYKIEGTKIK